MVLERSMWEDYRAPKTGREDQDRRRHRRRDRREFREWAWTHDRDCHDPASGTIDWRCPCPNGWPNATGGATIRGPDWRPSSPANCPRPDGPSGPFAGPFAGPFCLFSQRFFLRTKLISSCSCSSSTAPFRVCLQPPQSFIHAPTQNDRNPKQNKKKKDTRWISPLIPHLSRRPHIHTPLKTQNQQLLIRWLNIRRVAAGRLLQIHNIEFQSNSTLDKN